MTSASIVAGATYLPAFGEPRRRGEPRIVCGSDEDGVTLAVQAGERALDAAGTLAGSIDSLYVAVQNGAELAGPLPQIVREALGISADARVITATADDLGGYAMLTQALTDTGSGLVRRALVVAAEAATDIGERTNAGAAAVLVSTDTTGATLTEHTRASNLTHEEWFDSNAGQLADGRFLEHRWARLLDDLLARAGSMADIEGVITAGLTGPATHRVAERLGSGRVSPTSADFGIAGPLVAVVDAASRTPLSRLGLVALGSGQAVLAELETGASGPFVIGAGPAERLAPVARTAVGPAMPFPLESPFFARSWAETLRLEAARCDGCGHIVFPPTQRPICPSCHGHAWTPRRLARAGTVQSALENRFLPTGFGSRMVFVLAELEDGQVFSAPMPPEFGAGEVSIGDPVDLRLRRFSVRDGLPAYSMKFVPTPASEAPHES